MSVSRQQSQHSLPVCKNRPDHACSIALVNEPHTAYNGTYSSKHFQVTLHPSHANVIKRTFKGCTWNRDTKLWTFPWGGSADSLEMRVRLLSDMIYTSEQQPAANTPHPDPPHPDTARASTPYHDRDAPRGWSSTRKSPEGPRPQEPPAKFRAAEDRAPIPAPPTRQYSYPASAPTHAKDAGDDVEVMDMNYEARPIPDECRDYAVQQEKHYLYERKSDIYEDLHVTKRAFDGRVMCVCIYGTIPEVEAHFAARFSAHPQYPSYSCLVRRENRHHNRALRIVAMFI